MRFQSDSTPPNLHPMKPRLPLTLLAALTLSLTAPSGARAEHHQATALFNGRDLTHWSIQNHGQFSVQDGLLHVNRGTGWLRSDKTYGDFTLTLEVRFEEARANSGIFIRTAPTSHADENGWPDQGFQIQCMDTAEGENPIGTLIEYGGGPFEELFNPATIAAALKPAGEWNTLVITCVGDRVTTRLNDTLILYVQGLPRPDGHIGIQGEKGLLSFRKIEIEER